MKQGTDLLNEAEVLVETAVLGRQVDDFMRGDIGIFLLKMIESEYQNGVDRLKSANADDPDAIRTAQNMVWRAEQMKSWLRSAVYAGEKALAVLESREDEDFN